MSIGKQSAEMREGQDALDRFKKAMRTIVSVPKDKVVLNRKKVARKGKRRPSR